MPINAGLSRQLSEDYYLSLGRCFYNAQAAVQVLSERGMNAIYVEGYAAASFEIPIYHAWVEVGDEVIDPTWINLPAGLDRAIYIPVKRWRRATINRLTFEQMGAPMTTGTLKAYRECEAQIERV